MKLTKTCLILSAMTAMLIGLAGTAVAQTTTRNIDVSATVTKACDISAAGVAFGSYDPIGGSALDAAGGVTFNCTSGTVVSVTLDLGSNSAPSPAGTRKMAHGTDYLGYGLYEDSGRTNAWAATDTVSVTAGATSSTISIYGRLPAGQNVPAAAYADTVIATIVF